MTRPDTRRPRRRALGHGAASYVLGVAVSFVGGPLLLGAAFGGPTWVLGALAVVVVVTAAGCSALDRFAGPPDPDRTGVVLRGTTVAVVGCGTVLLGAWAGLQLRVHDVVPAPLLFAAAGVPFAAVATLQWPGRPRRITVGVLALAVLAAVLPQVPGALDAARDRRVLAVAGTLQRPWVTDAPGLELASVHYDGSEGVLASYLPVDGPAGEEITLRVQPSTAAPAGCGSAASLVSRYWEGLPLVDCRPVAAGAWRRTSAAGHEFLREVDGTTVAVGASLAVPAEVLRTAFDAARPMTDDEHSAWVDAEAAD
ncbi:hypothetical protein [Modestobacter sp. SYSU DS0290]